jgi:glucose/arabinose dehydrogenase
VPLRLDVVADGLDEPADIAVAPDGRLFVVERDGIVRAIGARGEQATTAIDGEILGLAIDADFERTHVVFAAAVTRIHDEGWARETLTLARYREVNGTLGERAVLLHGVSVRADRAAAALGVGPDGKLYLALDDGGDAYAAADPSSLNGKMLRLNADGTTADDPRGAPPGPAGGYRSPRALAWATDDVLWIAEGAPRSPERLSAIVPAPPRQRRTSAPTTYALPPNTEPSDAIVYRGDLFETFRGNVLVAAEAGYVLRLVVDPRNPTRIVATERLLEGFGPIRAIAVAPDGAIYIATARSIARLSPGR